MKIAFVIASILLVAMIAMTLYTHDRDWGNLMTDAAIGWGGLGGFMLGKKFFPNVKMFNPKLW